MGVDASTTTAFCTVDRVTSASFTSSSEAGIWRLHEIPKTVCGFGEDGTRWKYEKSSELCGIKVY
jgi:hypothetical protein